MPDATGLLEVAEDLLDARQVDDALSRFDQAEALGASADRCSAGRWMARMLRGEFEQAWRESDAIRLRGAPDPHRFWNGEALGGKSVVLRSLHGFGDAVQMLRFVPRLRELCGALVVEVPPRLLDLAPCFEGVESVITWGAQAPRVPPPWDVQMEVMELPYVLRVLPADLPCATRYIHLPSAIRRRVEAEMKPSRVPRVGIVWGAGDWNPSRTLPSYLVRELATTPGVEFWNLQGGNQQKHWGELTSGLQVRDAAELGEGILTLAAVIEQMDLVITVDTLAAHLAGALGKPAWVVLQYAADWRWMMNRSDTPWYPTLRLYRQSAPGDWENAVEQVRSDLETWTQRESELELAG